ncbi:MAG: hypothetical protein ACOC4M_11565 [Promethearchaeia archaeon]
MFKFVKNTTENKYGKPFQPFRGFLLAASTEFSSEEIASITVKLRKNNCELINL